MASDWLDYHVSDDEVDEAVLRARDAEITRMHPGPAFLIGALLAVLVVLGLVAVSL